MNEHEAMIAGVANKFATGGGVAALWGGLTASDIAAFGGLVVAIVGVCVQWYFNRKRDRREQELHTARLGEIRKQSGRARLAALGVAAVLALSATVITKWEGVRYTPYHDAVGVLTVCYGHTGPDVMAGRRYTAAECRQLLEADMAIANAAVRKCVGVPMLRGPEAGFTSLAFNIGGGAFCRSSIAAKARANDWPAACAAIDLYKYAGGRVLRGLELRRADERAVCEGRGSQESE